MTKPTTHDKAPERFRAVIFDLDGTLLDTLADIGDSVNTMLAEYGYPRHGLDDYRRFVGNGIHKLVTRALPPAVQSDERIDECVQRTRALYWENWNRKTRPYEGIVELLKKLQGAGCPMAVLSNKPHDFTRRHVDAYFPGTVFEAVMGHSDAFPAKPHPASALFIARQLGLPPSQFIFVGDSAVDMQTAHAAGMFAVGVAWGFRGAGELEKNRCRRLIDHPLEIPPLLDFFTDP
ncbi:MAG: HAD family hydrolase [Proteobacteria bacterium]|nr:MAG: HAD family hydrolase [Pseudomonadota bacterium]